MSSADPRPDSRFDAPVPVFPLPAVQMFPGALLPLHVFEPRYRALVRDAVAGARLIALPILVPGFEADYEGRPPLRPICGLGELIAHEPLADGRSNILMRGLARVRITEELPPDFPYRLARVAPLDDLCPDGFDDAAARESLMSLVERVALGFNAGGDTLRKLAREHKSTGALADVLAASLVSTPADRQEILETLDVSLRASLITGHLGALIAGSTPSGPSN
jgi:Lon protease-like protein